MFLCELDELDRRGLVSNQYLGDYMVDVICWHGDLLEVCSRFAQSTNARLGFLAGCLPQQWDWVSAGSGTRCPPTP